MNTAYLKLQAKKQLVNNHFKCFLISSLPYVTIVSLSLLNYYFFILLKGSDTSALSFNSIYAPYVRPTLLTVSLVFSFFLYMTIKIFSEFYFYHKSTYKNVTFSRVIKSLGFKKLTTAMMTAILKFFLSVAWCGFYLLPGVSLILGLVYYISTDEQSFNITITLFVSSIMLCLVGVCCIFITLKRYSMCNAVIFSSEEKDSLKIIEKSIAMMEGKSVRYTLYCLSFFGWIISCFAIIPVFYVLPYKKIAKYSFFNGAVRQEKIEIKNEKPIIFYFTKRIST